jgi:hypothetical protein
MRPARFSPLRESAGKRAEYQTQQISDNSDDFEGDVEDLDVGYPNRRKLARAAHEFAVYITSNAGSLIHYGERYRAGERIPSCLAESTVNAVISKRFAKRQQMQWTPCGTHLHTPDTCARRYTAVAI